MTAEQNYRLLLEIDANRAFILMAYQQNAELLARAEPRIRRLFGLADAEDPAIPTQSHTPRETG